MCRMFEPRIDTNKPGAALQAATKTLCAMCYACPSISSLSLLTRLRSILRTLAEPWGQNHGGRTIRSVCLCGLLSGPHRSAISRHNKKSAVSSTNDRHSIRVYLCSFVVPGLETWLQLADTQKTVQSEIFIRRWQAGSLPHVKTQTNSTDRQRPVSSRIVGQRSALPTLRAVYSREDFWRRIILRPTQVGRLRRSRPITTCLRRVSRRSFSCVRCRETSSP